MPRHESLGSISASRRSQGRPPATDNGSRTIDYHQPLMPVGGVQPHLRRGFFRLSEVVYRLV